MEFSFYANFSCLRIFLFVCFYLSISHATVSPLHKTSSDGINLQPITWNCVRRLEALTTWKFIQSRGYPNLLNVIYSRCSWKIIAIQGYRIRLAFRGVDLYADDPDHCSSNYVEIIDEKLKQTQARYCGKQLPNDIVSAGNSVRIDFQAQQGIATNSKGFSIGYSLTKDTSGFYNSKTFGRNTRIQDKRANTVSPTAMDKMRNIDAFPKKNEENFASTSTVIGALTTSIALLAIGVLLYKKRNRIHGNNKLLKKEIDEKRKAAAVPISSELLSTKMKSNLFEQTTSQSKPPITFTENRIRTPASNRRCSFKQKNLPQEHFGHKSLSDDLSVKSMKVSNQLPLSRYLTHISRRLCSESGLKPFSLPGGQPEKIFSSIGRESLERNFCADELQRNQRKRRFQPEIENRLYQNHNFLNFSRLQNRLPASSNNVPIPPPLPPKLQKHKQNIDEKSKTVEKNLLTLRTNMTDNFFIPSKSQDHKLKHLERKNLPGPLLRQLSSSSNPNLITSNLHSNLELDRNWRNANDNCWSSEINLNSLSPYSLRESKNRIEQKPHLFRNGTTRCSTKSLSGLSNASMPAAISNETFKLVNNPNIFVERFNGKHEEGPFLENSGTFRNERFSNRNQILNQKLNPSTFLDFSCSPKYDEEDLFRTSPSPPPLPIKQRKIKNVI